jgi:hypothetical protein
VKKISCEYLIVASVGRMYLMAQLTKEHIENIIRRRSSSWSQPMAEVTYLVALPFVAADDGIAAGESMGACQIAADDGIAVRARRDQATAGKLQSSLAQNAGRA